MRPLLILVLVLLVPSELAARDLAGEVPDVLTPWIPWVLDGRDERACPGSAAGGERLCAWPGRQDLDLDAEGGTFVQHWTLYAAGWVALPVGADHWPQEVRVGEVPAAVVERDGVPAVRLEAGEHPISGRFVWTRLPEGLTLPPASVLVELRLGGETRAFPRLSREGRLWLGTLGSAQADAAGDALGLTVSRRVEDDDKIRPSSWSFSQPNLGHRRIGVGQTEDAQQVFREVDH